MPYPNHRFFLLFTLFMTCLFFTPKPSHAVLGLFESKEMSAEEKQETVEKINEIQEKMKLLQEKLRALERRKASKQAAENAAKAGEKLTESPEYVNWLPIDETTVNPGEFGLYTYLLFNGDKEDIASVGPLEDFILTIETLPANEIPAVLANRFLVPVEKPQSIINLGRQPYDFKLNMAFLSRLVVPSDLPPEPVLPNN